MHGTLVRDVEQARALLAAFALALVLATSDHAAAPDGDARVLADADRRIWAADAARYAQYARAIRAEYRRFPLTAYAWGRRRFLRDALRAGRRSRIYFFLAEDAERAAVENLERELRCWSIPRVAVAGVRGRDPLARLAA